MSPVLVTRDALVQHLWPDKTLYASLMLLVTGSMGALYGLVMLSIGANLGDKVPTIFKDYPPLLTLLLSVATIVLAWLELKSFKLRHAIAGCVTGFLSMAMLGLVPLLSLVALGFVLKARAEGEHENPDTHRLSPDEWPDKSLAASMLLTVGGVITLAWGYLNATGQIAFEGYGVDPTVFGAVAALAGIVSVIASYFLYHQRGAGLGIAAALGGVAALGLYVVGPLLSGAALIAIWRAKAED